MVEQPATGRPKRFLNDDHRRNAYRRGGPQPADPPLLSQAGDPEPLVEMLSALADAVTMIPILREAWRTSSQPALETELATVRRRAEDLESQLAQARRNAERATEDARLALAQAEADRTQLEQHKSTVEQLRLAIEEREQAHAEIAGQAQRATQAAEASRSENEHLRGEVERAGQVIDRISARANDLENLLDKLQEEGDGVRRDLDQARADLAQAAVTIAETRTELRVEQQRRLAVEQLTNRAEQAQRDAVHRAEEQLTTERKAAEARLAALMADRDRLADQLARLTDRLAQIAETSATRSALAFEAAGDVDATRPTPR
jgi:archaellum component FlaC